MKAYLHDYRQIGKYNNTMEIFELPQFPFLADLFDIQYICMPTIMTEQH